MSTIINMVAVAGMLLAMVGLGQHGDSPRLFAWGFAICVGALVTGMKVLQQQITDLRSSSKEDSDLAD